MPLCDRQSYDGPKVWFSAMVGQEPDVEVWCTEDPGKPSLLYCLIKGSKEDIEAVANPPTGTLTFLFTDIEGSTKLWERDSSVMQVALARHDEILRSALEERGGYIFKTVGDAFCCAFPTAPDALEAALEIS